MSEKHASTSPSAIQVKNQQKAIGMLQADLKEVNKLLTYVMMLNSLIVGYIQFLIMLNELQVVLSV
jgi:hypothetical protein